ncbi:hypothetical protein A6770_10650 [Nostoc minutum NIES-26]|uniref:Uncharacterized protein n=1 Tax=Nostoc minutum NIES-26 TaxID=1844469 RepID=A0A367RUC1_9NOSO|nr:hypothetical protein A6770_10650 [Nostoc minutum NIES-26]
MNGRYRFHIVDGAVETMRLLYFISLLNRFISYFFAKLDKGLPNKKIINRLGEQGEQGRQREKKLDTGIGCRN